jgi:type II secretory pathway component GspD/PulD (secretin)
MLCCFITFALPWNEGVQAQSAKPVTLGVESVTAEEDAIGRENPFEQIGNEKDKSLFQRIFKSELPVQGAPEMAVQTIMLKFLDAQNVKGVLENMLSGYGAIAVDSKSNSLIISDTRDNLEKLVQEIRKADKTPQQVLIEVVILDVQLDDDTQIGVNWDILSDKIYDISYRQNLTTRLGSTIEDATTTGNATAFNTTGEGGDFVLVSGSIRNVVHLLQEKKNVEILASPRVLLISGGNASIRTIEEIPYREQTQTSGGGVLASTEFKEVGITLVVSALVTDDNEILLTVEPEQSVNTGVFGIDDVPIIDTRKAKTELLLRDGQIVAMGGLRRQEKTRERDQVPILGDLPLVGFLFRKETVTTKNSELIVFLSPHIYVDGGLSDAEIDKFNELRDKPLLEMPEEP